MKFRVLSMVAALALLAACESASDQQAATTGAGGGQPGGSVASGPTQSEFVKTAGDRVFFDFDKYDLKPAARATLEKQAAWLKKYPQASLVVEGHCDERGTREYNLALGERRANAAKDYLVALGIPASRIKIISYGKERPAVLGSSESAWSQNRRAVSVVQ